MRMMTDVIRGLLTRLRHADAVIAAKRPPSRGDPPASSGSVLRNHVADIIQDHVRWLVEQDEILTDNSVLEARRKHRQYGEHHRRRCRIRQASWILRRDPQRREHRSASNKGPMQMMRISSASSPQSHRRSAHDRPGLNFSRKSCNQPPIARWRIRRAHSPECR